MNGLRTKVVVATDHLNRTILGSARRPRRARYDSPSGAIRYCVGIDSQAVIDRGQQVLRRDGPVGGSGGVGVAGADDLAAADAAAGQGDAPDARPVVAAARRVEPRRAAELAGGDHQRRFQPAAPLEVVDQGREGLIEGRQQFAGVIVERAERRRAVAVPGDPVEDRLEHVDRDHANAGLDQPTRQQTALAEGRAAVSVADGGFSRQVEAFQCRSERSSPSWPLQRSARADWRRGTHARSSADRVESRPLDRHQVERVVSRPSQPADWPWGMSTPVLAIGPGRITNGGQFRFGPSQPGDHRAEVGMLFARPAEPAGLEQLVARLMDRRRVVMHRANERHAVHPRRQPRQMLGDPNARATGRDRAERSADLRRGVGLGVPGLELAGSADQQEQDHRAIRLPARARPGPPSSGRQSPNEPSPASNAETAGASLRSRSANRPGRS